MARLNVVILAVMTALSAYAADAAPSSAEMRWEPLIAAASARFGIPPDWIGRVIQAESSGHTTLLGKAIRSRAGAIGLMQLMPRTWEEMRSRYALGRNPDDPHDNVMAGTAYLRLMYNRFGYPGLFAAYNAGPSRYTAYLQSRATLPGETTAYLRLFTGLPPLSSAPATLFALRSTPIIGARRTRPFNPSALFAIVELGSAAASPANNQPDNQGDQR